MFNVIIGTTELCLLLFRIAALLRLREYHGKKYFLLQVERWMSCQLNLAILEGISKQEMKTRHQRKAVEKEKLYKGGSNF